MGMFDEITCDYPLPDGFQPNEDIRFQTKDLENALDHYRISPTGKLTVEAWHFDPIPEEEKQAASPAESTRMAALDELANSFRRHSDGDQDVPFTGSVTFYWSNLTAAGPEGFATAEDAPYDNREYTATFQDGQLLTVTGGQKLEDNGTQLPRAELFALWQQKFAAQESAAVSAEDALMLQATSGPTTVEALTSFTHSLLYSEALGPHHGHAAVAEMLLKGAQAITNLRSTGTAEQCNAAAQSLVKAMRSDGKGQSWHSSQEDLKTGLRLLVYALGVDPNKVDLPPEA